MEIKEESYDVKYSADHDTKWLNKGDKCYFGCSGFIRGDTEEFIYKAHTATANSAETKELTNKI